MSTRHAAVSLAGALLLGAAFFMMPALPVEGSAGADTAAVAKRLVGQCAGVREGDLVWISGSVRDLTLLEDLAVETRRSGAHPIVTLESDRLTRKMYTDVPETYDTQTPELALKMASLITASINVDSNETEGLLADIPPARITARGKAGQPIGQVLQARGVRQVNLGNGLYPTDDLSKRYGVPKEELAKIFWAGVNVDYKQLQATGEKVRSALAAGRELRVTNPNGTDLRMRIEGRRAFVSDGVISEEEQAMGGPACQTWLPAGEVYLAPVPGTAEGKVVVERQFFQGRDVEGLTLVFKGGRLASMTARSGLEPLKAFYDSAGAGKDEFAAVDIGINPNVSLVPDSRMVAWMPAGMVTVGFGNNTWAGGENSTNFGLFSFLPGSTVTVDGKAVVEGGRLKM